MTIPPDFLWPYIASNVVALFLLATAYKWPRVAKFLFVLLFLGAGAFNMFTAIADPEAYLFFADLALLDAYRNFIIGFFTRHTIEVVALIALGQLVIAGLLGGSGTVLKAGVIGGVVFFVAIAPLGAGSAFPSTLLLAAALVLMQRRLR